MKTQLTLLFFLFTISCAHADKMARGCETINGEEYCLVSMVSLLVNPDNYNNKRIIVTGYYKSAPEMSGLFLTKDHAQIEDFTNAVWISYNKDSQLAIVRSNDKYWKEWLNSLADSTIARNQYVQVVGIYHSGTAGHFGVYQGELSEVPGFVLKSKPK